MPHILLIDGPDEILQHSVTDRKGSRDVLAYDLQQTADPKWSADILAAFDAGENEITRPNGSHDTFTVQYLP